MSDEIKKGLLGIVVKGEKRFRVNSYSRAKDKLCIGDVDWLSDDEAQIPDSYQNFSDLLKEIVTRYKLPIANTSTRYDEANWVSERLAMKSVEDGLRAIFADGHQNNIIDKMQTRKKLYDLVEYEKYNSLDEKIYNFSTDGHE